MVKRSAAVALLTVGLLSVLVGSKANATSRVVPSWQSILAEAGFVGVVKCEIAGGIVARYRVLDSWKGPPNGSQLLIGRQVDEWEPQYPLALVGETYFVAANSAQGSWSLPPSARLGSVPLWWRQIPPQYFDRWGPSRTPPPKPGWARGILALARDGQGASLDSFRMDVLHLLDRDEKSLELEVLRAGAQWTHVTSAHADPQRVAEPCTTSVCLAVQSDSLPQVVSKLINISLPGGFPGVLADGGRWESLRQLELLPKTSGRFSPEMLELTKRRIRVRLGLETPIEPDPYEKLGYSDTTTVRLVLALNSGPGRRLQFREAFERLTIHDPRPVVQFLLHWTAPSRTWADSGAGYNIGSYFAYRCGKDRRKHLTELLKAHDPYVRVAAAVYLCFEDASDGKQALIELMALPGDAGAWAALTLARRGDKTAMPRALQVLAERGPYEMAGVPHKNLQKRIMELISNSAATNGVALPNDWNPEYSTDDTEPFSNYANFYGWWQANAGRINLHDPWLEILAAKKID